MKKYSLYDFSYSHNHPEAIKPGDLVKLTFEPTNKSAMTENMWVIVTKGAPKFEGTLDNIPLTIKGLDLGDTVRFSMEHIRNWEPKEL